MTTLENLQAKIAKLQAQAEAVAKKQSSTVIEKIRELMEKHGLTTADIDAHVGGKKRGRRPGGASVPARSAGAAKYRDPRTGATWTGHGRAPAWIANAKDRSKFAIAEDSARAAHAAGKVTKAGNYVRGPQAPKYRDPKTGATWSGRGPAPAWLASVTDRTAFLISVEAVSAPKAGVARKASAKKTATKKVTSRKAAAKQETATNKPVAAAKKSPAKKASIRKVAAKKVVAKKATTSAAAGQTSAQGSGETGTPAAA